MIQNQIQPQHMIQNQIQPQHMIQNQIQPHQQKIFMTEEKARIYLRDIHGHEIPSNITPFSYATNFDYKYLYTVGKYRDIFDMNNIVICDNNTKSDTVENLYKKCVEKRKKLMNQDENERYNSFSHVQSKNKDSKYFPNV